MIIGQDGTVSLYLEKLYNCSVFVGHNAVAGWCETNVSNGEIMYLRNINIIGFRGINRLSITLRPNMVLIGENAWGKSSLLDALSLIFNTQHTFYQFVSEDFHLQHNKNHQQSQQLMLLFTFSESFIGEKNEDNCRPYSALFAAHEDNYHRLYLRVSGEINENGSVMTQYAFLNQSGEEIQHDNAEALIISLIQKFTVYRFRDARLNHRANSAKPLGCEGIGKEHQLYEEIEAFSLLLQYYFFSSKSARTFVSQLKDTTELWQKVKNLCIQLKKGDSCLRREVFEQLSQLFVSPLQVKTERISHPIVLFEDPDARLHPRMMAIIWELMSYLPIQRITTTNSVELLSRVELRSICRLVRYPNETKAFQLAKYSLSKQALRRLTFHIHYNRSIALFSNVWIFVEGETEVWLLSALADLLDINLEMEGIRIVEFAQSGLTHLLKYAKAMGIEWHVLTDGDSAGQKYAEVVKQMLDENESVFERLTILPKKDIEHFLYFSGFSSVFLQLARWKPQGNYYPVSKIINAAIKRTSKPDLALAISEEIEKIGPQAIPTLFHRLFSKVLNLTKV